MKRKIMVACCVAVALSAAAGCATADGNGKNAETAAEQEEKRDECHAAADFIGNETKAYLRQPAETIREILRRPDVMRLL